MVNDQLKLENERKSASLMLLFNTNDLAIPISKLANLIKEIICTAMATLHSKNFYYHSLQILAILNQRFKSIHLLFGIQRRSNRNRYFLQTRDYKIWIHLSPKTTLFISQEIHLKNKLP